MKKNIMLLAAMLTTAMFTAAPAFAQTGQEIPEAGVDATTLFTLGLGVLLIAGGLLVRRIFGKF